MKTETRLLRLLHHQIADLAVRLTPWEDVERALSQAASADGFYLGGDGLRPYACYLSDERFHLFGFQPDDLPLPPLVKDLLDGEYGPPTVVRDSGDPRLYDATVPVVGSLIARMNLPSVLLIALGDADKYRGARLNLGVARLAQWLRFTHAARVSVIDYCLTVEPLEAVEARLAGERFDIIGISVNFGQWSMLTTLAAAVNKVSDSLVVLGNILAAFSPHTAAALFDAAAQGRVFVATSLGERPVESLCRSLGSPEGWDNIPGLVRPRPGSDPPLPRPRRVTAGQHHPPELVFPDDELVLAVANRGGQVSFETSFGCQYGTCAFCPRGHRGSGWSRGDASVAVAAMARLEQAGALVSLVDEDFFGAEGRIDPPKLNSAASRVLAACRRADLSYEIYTRLEQLFDRRHSRDWNLARAQLLLKEAPLMRRVFVGVESGSPSQLRRFRKGQTVEQTIDALRVASMLGVPLEFGFITFDPLLTETELADNIEFLGRRDVIAALGPEDAAARIDQVGRYLDGADLIASDLPLYRNVAYMATEMEVLAGSQYLARIRRRYPHLLDGTFDPEFARYGVRYSDPRIGDVAGWCRVWTEGMFTPVYAARMTARASGDARAVDRAMALIARYRDRTFELLVALTGALLPELTERLGRAGFSSELAGYENPMDLLERLAGAVLPDGPDAAFNPELRRRRRDR